MFRFYSNCEFTGAQGVNWVALLAVFVSLLSIFCSLYFIYLTKRMEIVNQKFQKFSIASLDALFAEIDNKFDTTTIRLNKRRQQITNAFVEIQVFITVLKKIYPSIPIEELVLDIEAFTDKVYSTQITNFAELKSDYLATKLMLYNKLYNFALQNELSLFGRMGLKPKNRKTN